MAESKFDIESALKEVQEKTEAQVEKETAYKWASRACACYKLYKQTSKIKWYIQAADYAHEAIEHASLVYDGGDLVGEIQAEIEKYEIEPSES